MKTKLSEGELKARKRERDRRYATSEKGKETMRRYAASRAGMASHAKYRLSPKGKANRAKHSGPTRVLLSEEERKVRKTAGKKRYDASPAGIETRRRGLRKYRATEHGKQRRRADQIKRRARKLEQTCTCCDPRELDQTYAAGWMEQDCYVCGAAANVMDHVIPLAAGNPGDALHCLENLSPICTSCNTSKNARHYPGTPGWEDFLQMRKDMRA